VIEVVIIAVSVSVLSVGWIVYTALKRKKLKPIPRPNRVPYDSKRFRK